MILFLSSSLVFIYCLCGLGVCALCQDLAFARDKKLAESNVAVFISWPFLLFFIGMYHAIDMIRR